MKKLVLLMIIPISLFNVSGTGKPSASKKTTDKTAKASPRCGPFIWINNTTSFTVTAVVVELDNTNIYTVSNPSFPFEVPAGLLSNGDYIINFLFPLQGDGYGPGSVVESVHSSSTVINCSAFDEGTYIAGVEFSEGCDLIDVTLTDAACAPLLNKSSAHKAPKVHPANLTYKNPFSLWGPYIK